MSLVMIERFLRQSSLAAHLRDDDFKVLARYLKLKTVPGETPLFEEGEKALSMYIVGTGRVELSSRSDSGKRIVSSMVRKGGVFGISALLDDTSYERSAFCCDKTTLCTLDSPSFVELCERHPDTAGRLLKVIRELIRRSAYKSGEKNSVTPLPGKVVSFFSAKGGVGKTFLAANLSAVAATRIGLSVAVLELDLQFGNLDCFMGVVPSRTISQLAFEDELNKIHPQMIKGFAEEPVSGVHVFFRPREVFDSDSVDSESITTLITKLQEVVDLIVIDCKSGFDDVILTSLDLSDKVYVVTTADFAGVVSTQALVKVLTKLGYSSDKLSLIVNRLSPKKDLSPARREDLFDGLATTALPEEPKVYDSLKDGELWAFANPSHFINSELVKIASLFNRPSQQKSLVESESHRETLVQKWLDWLGGAPKVAPQVSEDSVASSGLHTRSASASFAIGQANFLVGKYTQARAFLLSATETGANLDEPWYYLGKIAAFDHDYSLARWYFEKARAAAPDRLRNEVEVALVDCQGDELRQVLEKVLGHLEKAPAYADVNLLAARVYQGLSDFERAMVYVHKALTSNDSYVDALTAQGAFFRCTDRKKESLVSLGKSLNINNTNPQAWFELGHTYCDLQLYSEAKRAFACLLELYPGHRPTHKMLVKVQQSINVLHDEVRQYGDASHLHPGFGDLCFELGVSYYQLGRFDDSLIQLEKAEDNGFDIAKTSGLKRLIGIVKPLVVSQNRSS